MKLDWKWIGYGVLIMFGLSILVGVLMAIMLAPGMGDVSDPSEIELSGGQLALMAVLGFLIFAVGGFIVGVRSAGRTILEPAIAAAIVIAINLLMSGNLAVGSLLAAGLVPFLAALLGGWLGERRQETRSNG